jgi:hypothetical protein
MSVAKKRPPRFRVGDSVAVLFGPQWVGGEIMEDRGLLGEYRRRLYRVRINSGQEDEYAFEVPEENIRSSAETGELSDTPGIRQEFIVSYARGATVNEWTATIKPGRLYRGIRASGAVGYTTVRRGKERQTDENHAIVAVLVECDQTMCDQQGRIRTSALPSLKTTARRLADRMFKKRHTDATVVHLDEPDLNGPS